MELYTQASILPNQWQWPEPMETVWQLLGTGPGVPRSKSTHSSAANQLSIAAVANIPRPIRPWGAITWLANTFQTSRPTVYALGERAAEGLIPSLGGRPTNVRPAETSEAAVGNDVITVTSNRIARTALTMAFPGKAALRPMQTCLEVAFDQTRGVGTLSELLTQTG